MKLTILKSFKAASVINTKIKAAAKKEFFWEFRKNLTIKKENAEVDVISRSMIDQ